MNLQELQTKSETTKTVNQRQQDLQNALLFAFERTKTEPFDVTGLIQDVLSEFPKAGGADFIIALRNGSLGMYGRTFKLSTQEICFWVREYLKQFEKNNIGRL
jgi:hypothetical protein